MFGGEPGTDGWMRQASRSPSGRLMLSDGAAATRECMWDGVGRAGGMAEAGAIAAKEWDVAARQ